ncbi:unnamed protein product, partial [Cuscuta epithymum]
MYAINTSIFSIALLNFTSFSPNSFPLCSLYLLFLLAVHSPTLSPPPFHLPFSLHTHSSLFHLHHLQLSPSYIVSITIFISLIFIIFTIFIIIQSYIFTTSSSIFQICRRWS